MQIEEGGVNLVVEHLRCLGEPLWSDHVHLLELNGDFALVKDGRLVSVFGTPAAASPTHLLLQEGEILQLLHFASKGPKQLFPCKHRRITLETPS